MKKIIVISYLFSLTALSMFVYSTFFSNVAELRTQGIYWFGIALVCLLIPKVNKLKLMDVEVEFKQQLQRVEKQLAELEDDFFKHFTTLQKKESEMSEDFLERRNRHWDNFERYVLSLDDEERFQIQKLNSLDYLKQYGLTVKELKERLARLRCYKGKIDDEFTTGLAEALTRFQRLNNMRHVDGLFGPLTYEKIVEKLRDAPKESSKP